MSDDNSDSVLDKAKGALEEVIGAKPDVNLEDPKGLADDLNLSPHMRQDVGLGLRDVDSNPYGGSAGSQALEMAEGITPGTKRAVSDYRDDDSALAPMDVDTE
ncbi:MAG TPA: hypothetical protein VFB58_01100 [Chloroflexota bacterium]|nr:hypothetical protein [Chloroflexota bacterium]